MIKIAQSKPNFSQEDYESLRDCFTSQWYTEGPKAEEFIKQIKEITGAKYCVLAPNGTLALYLGLLALGIKEGDVVIVPNSTFIASATSVCLTRALPLFVDVDESQQIDIDKLEELIDEWKRQVNLKAIMPVHLWGSSCDIEQVNKIANKYKLKVIEDACQALGIKYKNKGCGTFGDIGCFSFFADKAISTIEGGAVTTNNKQLYNKLLYLRNQGRLNRGSFIHPEFGVNFRMNDLQCSLGLSQLKKKDFIFNRRREIFERYEQNLRNVKQIQVIGPILNSTYIPFRTVIITRDKQEKVAEFLNQKGIEIRSMFYPLHKQPCFKKLNEYFQYQDKDFMNSIRAFNFGMCLPNYPELTNEEIDYICNCLKEYYNV